MNLPTYSTSASGCKLPMVRLENPVGQFPSSSSIIWDRNMRVLTDLKGFKTYRSSLGRPDNTLAIRTRSVCLHCPSFSKVPISTMTLETVQYPA